MINVTQMLRRLAANIRRRRIELGLTQQQLAERAGISSKYLAKLEASRLRGSVCPSVAVFVALCRALDVSTAELLEGAAPAPSARARATRRMAHRDLSRHVLQTSDGSALLLLRLVEHILELERSHQAPVAKPETLK